MNSRSITLLHNDSLIDQPLENLVQASGYVINVLSGNRSDSEYIMSISSDLLICTYDWVEQYSIDIEKLGKVKPNQKILMVCGISHIGNAIDAVNNRVIDSYITRSECVEKLPLILKQLLFCEYGKKKDFTIDSQFQARSGHGGAMDELEIRYPGITKDYWQQKDSGRWN